MQNTKQQGTYKNLFEGKSQSVVQCKNIAYESPKDDVFNTLQLSVKGNKNIEDSIRQYIEAEDLDEPYQTDEHGK